MDLKIILKCLSEVNDESFILELLNDILECIKKCGIILHDPTILFDKLKPYINSKNSEIIKISLRILMEIIDSDDLPDIEQHFPKLLQYIIVLFEDPQV